MTTAHQYVFPQRLFVSKKGLESLSKLVDENQALSGGAMLTNLVHVQQTGGLFGCYCARNRKLQNRASSAHCTWVGKDTPEFQQHTRPNLPCVFRTRGLDAAGLAGITVQ